MSNAAHTKINKDILTKYPFLKDILKMPLAPDGEKENRWYSKLDIKFEKADGDMMFRQADNMGLKKETWRVSSDSKRANQIFQQGEYLFSFNEKGHVIRNLKWPETKKIYWKTPLVLGRDIFLASGARKKDASYLFDEAKWLVWVTVRAWHEDTGADTPYAQARYGKFVNRTISMTVYKSPHEGFDELFKNSRMEDHLRLNSDTFQHAYRHNDEDVIQVSGNLSELANIFQETVYRNGLKRIFKEAARTITGKFGSVTLTCGKGLGMTQFKLEDKKCRLCFLIDNSGSRIVPGSIDGTIPQFRSMVLRIMKEWDKNQEPDKGLTELF